MTEHDRLSRKEKGADGEDACEPSMKKISEKTNESKTKEKRKGGEGKQQQQSTNSQKRQTENRKIICKTRRIHDYTLYILAAGTRCNNRTSAEIDNS